MTSALDRLLPRYQFVERHKTVVTATPQRAFAAIEAVDLSDSDLARGLMAVWRIPARLFVKNVPNRPMSVRDFIALWREPNRDLVRGLVGGVARREWSAEEFTAYDGPGFKLAWGFTVTDLGDGRCRIDTETRVNCCDAKTKRWFTLYWYIIRLPSGAIRRDMLRIIKGRAEAN
jgi:hypothetical protein